MGKYMKASEGASFKFNFSCPSVSRYNSTQLGGANKELTLTDLRKLFLQCSTDTSKDSNKLADSTYVRQQPTWPVIYGELFSNNGRYLPTYNSLWIETSERYKKDYGMFSDYSIVEDNYFGVDTVASFGNVGDVVKAYPDIDYLSTDSEELYWDIPNIYDVQHKLMTPYLMFITFPSKENADKAWSQTKGPNGVGWSGYCTSAYMLISKPFRYELQENDAKYPLKYYFVLY